MTTNPYIHIFGEVLFDNFPDGSRVLGGAPFNVAWHLQAFGQAPRFISRIGEDVAGQEIATLMDTWGMRRDGLQTDPDHPTGSVQVRIEDGEPQYDIVVDSAYDFITAPSAASLPTQGILYHGSLAVRNPVSRAALTAVKAGHQGKVFVDINLREPWWERSVLHALLQDTDWVKLNQAELIELCPDHPTLEKAMQAFCTQFAVDTLVVTRGAKGAIACHKEGPFVKASPPTGAVNVVDTVGAGDAFASVLLLGLRQQWPLETTLERAQDFASALVGKRGATVADPDFYATFIRQWH